MLMLSHAAEVSRNDLYSVETPEPTQSWKPVPHIEVVNTLTDREVRAARRYTLR
jgi:hypothetical protein